MSSAEAPWRAAPNPIRVCEWCSTGRAWMRLAGVRKLAGDLRSIQRSCAPRATASPLLVGGDTLFQVKRTTDRNLIPFLNSTSTFIAESMLHFCSTMVVFLYYHGNNICQSNKNTIFRTFSLMLINGLGMISEYSAL